MTRAAFRELPDRHPSARRHPCSFPSARSNSPTLRCTTDRGSWTMRSSLPTIDARSHAPGRSLLAAYAAASSATARAPGDRETHMKKERLTPANPGFPDPAAESAPDGCKEMGQNAPKNIGQREPLHHPRGLHLTSGLAAREGPVSGPAESDFAESVPSLQPARAESPFPRPASRRFPLPPLQPSCLLPDTSPD